LNELGLPTRGRKTEKFKCLLCGNVESNNEDLLLHFQAVFRIRIHVFFGHPDPLVRGMDPDPALYPDPSIIMQK
jgi:hypothetical protein